jgi:LCP family protein required for cell wall assembly
MNHSESPISRRGQSALRHGAALAFAGIIASSAFVTGPAPVRAAVDASAPGQALDAPSAFTVEQSRRILGTDGRFTVLLLGSDGRRGVLMSRTDAILVASVDPSTRKAAIFSIPRDTVRFPTSRTGRYAGKINALLPSLHRAGKRPAGTALRKIIGSAMNIEIDAYALIGFNGFRKLVDNVGGVRVYVPRTLRDPKYTYLVRGRRVRAVFTAGWQTLLNQRALAYARIRYVDNDYARARRQQQLIVAAIQQVQSRTVARLAGLVAASTGVVLTDLPVRNPSDLEYIFAVVGQANLATAARVVFGPSTYASRAGTASIALKITACRTWIARNFPRPRPGGTWLPPA